MSELNRVRAGLDYLTVSKVQDERPHETVVAVAKTFETNGEVVNWQHGYSGVDICGGNGQALSRPCYDQIRGDVLIRLPGRAVEWIKDRNMLSDGEYNCTDADICRYFVEQNFYATRVDVALDTNDPEVTLPIVEQAVKERMFTCRAKRAGSVDTWEIDKPETRGQEQTVTLGKRTSSRYMRVYNKRAEVLQSLKRDIGHMTRFELEIKGEAATKIMDRLARYGADLIPGIFTGWVNFKDGTDDEPRIDRKRNAPWWERLVNNAEPVILGLTRSATNPERSTKWLKHGVAKTLGLALDHGLLPEIKTAIANKKHKVTPRERMLWENYEEQRNQKKTVDSLYSEGASNGK